MNNRFFQALLLCTFIFSCGNAFASVQVTENQKKYTVGQHLEYLKETEHPLTLEDILTTPADAFTHANEDIPNFGQVSSAYWFKLVLDHQLPHTKRWLLELNFPFLDQIEVYSPDGQGNYHKTLTGDELPFHQRPIITHNFVFDIELPPNTITAVYFRVKTTTSLQMPLTLWDHSAFLEKIDVKNYGFGIYYGIMLVMIFYNLFVYFLVRDISYLYYISYIGFITVANLAINGFGYQYLWPNSPGFANYSIPLFLNLSFAFGCLFTRSFLATKQFTPKLDTILRAFTLVSFVAVLFTLIWNRSDALKFTILLNFLVSFAILATSFYGVFKRQRRAYFFCAAWTTLCVGAILRGLVSLDFIPSNFFTFYSVQLGVAIEVLILSLALADRINTERAEKQQATETALSALERQRQAESKLVHQSMHDLYTQAPNRNFCLQHLEQLHINNPMNYCVSAVCIQLNNFHDINYTLGHDTGNEVLINLILKYDEEIQHWPNVIPLKNNEGHHKVIAKVDGVCLGVFFKHQTEQSIQQIVHQLTNLLHEPMLHNDMRLDLSGHIGVAICPDHDNTPEGLIRKAMVAAKAAKRNKKESIIYDNQIDRYSSARLTLMGELKHAIEHNELELYYHPKIELATQKVVGVEALIRWNHPKQGVLGPFHFIDVAEGTGIITPLTQWVIDQAFEDGKAFNQQGYSLNVAVNASVRNLLEDNFVEKISGLLNKHQFPAEQFTLEVVESAMIEDHENTLHTLNRLKDLGLKLSIDDFGTGYSSLSYLKHLPAHEVKIDRSFIQDLLHNDEDQFIVETTILMSHKLNLHVVAEGIEDKETLAHLTEIGCDIAQGFYFCKPMPKKELISWLSQYHS
ncbi:EAL domain-containing protein [Litoribacillus peritrichatus]|uniref:EAL domain-containing protein n=1 Tax=Litoribacillus peritrichatus TaxID=718191 RepID=A0ABP7MU78_9GAMM